MRIALITSRMFGKGILNVLRARGATVAGVLSPSAQTGADPLSDAARAAGIPVVAYETLAGPRTEDALRGLNADIALVGPMGDGMPPGLQAVPPRGMLQAHLSLLPRYRGPSPVSWLIARGEVETGVTIIRPTQMPCEGPVILQRVCVIGPEDTAGSLCGGALLPLAMDALADAAGLVMRGEHLEIEQDEGAATYEGTFGEAEAEIRWVNHAEIVHNLIRAASPEPGAWTLLGGRKLRILEAGLRPTRRHEDVRGGPGEVIATDKKGFSVSAPGGIIEVRRVAAEGSGAVSAADFAKTADLSPGRRLGG